MCVCAGPHGESERQQHRRSQRGDWTRRRGGGRGADTGRHSVARLQCARALLAALVHHRVGQLRREVGESSDLFQLAVFDVAILRRRARERE